jgi:hypothetical protein
MTTQAYQINPRNFLLQIFEITDMQKYKNQNSELNVNRGLMLTH